MRDCFNGKIAGTKKNNLVIIYLKDICTTEVRRETCYMLDKIKYEILFFAALTIHVNLSISKQDIRQRS